MLLWIVVLLVILWLLGFFAHIGGTLIWILLVLALVVLVYHFATGRGPRDY
jgi:4-hydroxybenzoate polyprenyltransferase